MKVIYLFSIGLLSLFSNLTYAGYINMTSLDKKADVVFIVDNSGSMATYQDQLNNEMPEILKKISSVYASTHIGVLTTSPKISQDSNGHFIINPDGKFKGFDKSGTLSEVESALDQNFNVGTAGHYDEMLYVNIMDSFTNPGNAGFYRDDADLILFFITDSNDQSEVTGLEFLTVLKKFKGSLDKVQIKGILSVVTQAGQACNGDGGEPQSLLQLMTFVNSQAVSICETNWSDYINFN